MMHCNGKCYVAKQLKEQESQDQQSPQPKKEKLDFNPFYLPNDVKLLNNCDVSDITFCNLPQISTSDFPRVIFHPPTM